MNFGGPGRESFVIDLQGASSKVWDVKLPSGNLTDLILNAAHELRREYEAID